MARGGGGDARLRPIGGLQSAPAPLERAGVVGGARQQLDDRLHLVFLGQRRRDGVALEELARQAQDLVPGAGAALGAQQHALRRNVFGPACVQAAQRIARGAVVALLEGQLGARHQQRRALPFAGRLRPLQPAIAAREVAHLVRGAGSQQRRAVSAVSVRSRRLRAR